MAISTTFEEIEKKFNSKKWKSIKEFEKYYLRDLSERLSQINYYTDKEGVKRTIPPVDHYLKLKEYDVWAEGYTVTGYSQKASWIGKVKARNFAQACHILMCRRYLEEIEIKNRPTYGKFPESGRWDYDPDRLTYWGCKLFWSEELANK